MLSLADIQKAYPEALRGFRQSLLREYLQCKILAILFDSAYASKFAFLGGTCLRLLHHNNRFSEDLDFDNFDLTETEFESVSRLIQEGLEREGLVIEMRNVFKGAYHCYIKFPNLLYASGLSGHQEEKILIQLDTEPQHFPFHPETLILNRFDVFVAIPCTPPDLLLAQKFFAIFNRRQPKGRDFYDATFLLAKTRPNYDYLMLKSGISSPSELRSRVLDHLAKIDLEAAARDVEPFLFEPNEVKRVQHFDTFIKTAAL
jgi:predicted nucleotidyltransferase component of viral defense system